MCRVAGRWRAVCARSEREGCRGDRGKGAAVTPGLLPSLSLAVLYDNRVKLDSELRITGIRSIWQFGEVAPEPGGDSPTVEIPYLIEFIGRGFVGRLDLTLQWRSGIGDVLVSETHPLDFESDRAGVRHGHTLRIAPRASGLCWLELFLDGQFITKIPALFSFTGQDAQLVAMRTVGDGDLGGPYVSIATFARFFEHTDRDRLTIAETTHQLRVATDDPSLDDWEGQELAHKLQACIRLIPGGVSGRKTGLVTWRHPDGRVSEPQPVDLIFRDVITPLDIRLGVDLDFTGPGTYELRLDVDGKRVCVLPLELQPGINRRSP